MSGYGKHYDVVIAGGGMVGMALANALGQAQLSVAVIEKYGEPELNDAERQFQPRVSAINLSSERLLRHLGAWQRISADRLSAYKQMNVWDGAGSGKLEFSTETVESEHLGHIIENDRINAALWQQARTHANIDLIEFEEILSWRTENLTVIAQTKSGEQLSCQLLVGSEGKLSPVRKQTAIRSQQWSYQQTAIVTTVRHAMAHQQTARQVFLDTGPLAFLPLPGKEQQLCSIVWSANTDRADQLMQLSDEQFSRALGQALEHDLGDIQQVERRHAFPLSAFQAQSYFNGPVAILGDAAHVIHPLAGLGVNLGFLDAATLASEITRAYERKIPIADAHVLRRYQRQRQSHNYAVAALMETLKRLFNTSQPALTLLRNAGMSWINQSPLAKRPLILAAQGDFGVPLPPLCQPISVN